MVGNKYKFAEFVSYDNMTHSRTYDLLAPEESNQPLGGRELRNSSPVKRFYFKAHSFDNIVATIAAKRVFPSSLSEM